MKYIPYILVFLSVFYLSFNLAAQFDQKNIVKGDQLFKDKNFQEAQEQYKAAKEYFQEKGEIQYMAEAMQLEAKAITHQYKMQEALEKYKAITKLGENENNPQIQALGLNAEATIYSFLGEREAAKKNARAILNLDKNKVENSYFSDSYTIIADQHMHNLAFDSAAYYYDKAIVIDSLSNNIKSIVFNMTGIGNAYIESGNKSLGLDYFFRAVDLLRDGVDDFKKATIYRNLSDIFLKDYNLPKAKEYANESLKISKDMSMVLNMAESYRSLGSIAYYEKNYPLAIVYNEKAEEIYKDKNKIETLASIHLNKANTYSRMNHIDSAGFEIREANKLKDNIQSSGVQNRYLFANSLFHLKAKNIKEAENYFNQFSSNSENTERVYDQLSVLYLNYELFKAQGKYLRAIEKLEEYSALVRKLDESASAYITHELETKYQKAEDEKKISSLKAKDEFNSLKIEQRNKLIWIGGISLLALLGIVLFIAKQNRTIKKMMVELQEKNVLITKTLGEKELLLKEIHHRVKNNLQVVSSILSIQSRDIQDENALEAISESRNRVKSMAIIHQNLYQADNLTGINTKEYIEKLSNSLFNSYRVDKDRLEMVNNVQELNLDVDTTIPLGLILNELITNALKYAFPDERHGEINVELKEENDTLILTVKDNGVGISQNDNNQESFGLKMIQTFARKLEAEWEVKTKNGTEVCMRIKKYKLAS